MTGASALAGGRRGAEWALATGVALELGVFGALAEGPLTPEELAARLGLSPRGTEILVGVLVELDLVREDREGLRLTGPGRARFVDRDTPDFEADALRLWLTNIRDWASGLGIAVRRGAPLEETTAGGGPAGDEEEDEEADREQADEQALGGFMAAMANKPPERVEAVVEACLGRLHERRPPSAAGEGAGRALDLGGGPGTFARALAERGLEVVLADRPEVIDFVARAYDLAGHPRIGLWRGDFLEALPEGPFDLVLAANITHLFDPATNAELVARLHPLLAPGGVLGLLDFVRGESEFASLFALTMLRRTERGNTYARTDYDRWLHDAGFRELRFQPIDADRHVVTARRPA